MFFLSANKLWSLFFAMSTIDWDHRVIIHDLFLLSPLRMPAIRIFQGRQDFDFILLMQIRFSCKYAGSKSLLDNSTLCFVWILSIIRLSYKLIRLLGSVLSNGWSSSSVWDCTKGKRLQKYFRTLQYPLEWILSQGCMSCYNGSPPSIIKQFTVKFVHFLQNQYGCNLYDMVTCRKFWLPLAFIWVVTALNSYMEVVVLMLANSWIVI
jgi:hypothetical protein